MDSKASLKLLEFLKDNPMWIFALFIFAFAYLGGFL